MKKGIIGASCALLASGCFALMSVFAGPIHNLNDIGTFANRVLFIAMTAAAYLLLLLMTAALHQGSVWRMLLRQGVVTAGLLILLTGINQKTLFYVENLQPLVRAMDTQGLSAAAGWETNLSAPAMTLLYLVTRGPVYDMYSVKLLCIFCFLALCIAAVYLADRRIPGLRADALFCLCVILPQGFMSAGCTAQLDIVCAALLAAALLLAMEKKDCRWIKWTAAVLYGLALCVSGLALYALPMFICLVCRKRLSIGQMTAALAAPVLFCVPAMLCGMPAAQALVSLLRANLALPEFAAGSPGMMSLIPRAQVAEMPIMSWMQHLPQIDAVTNAQPYYTQAHFEVASLGLSVAGIAIYGGVFAWLLNKKNLTDTAKAFALVLTALIVCPGVTNAAWITAALAGLYAAFAERKLRLPAFMVIFAASGAAVYPMTGEILLPMAAAFALCLCALLMTLDIIPTTLNMKESENGHD